MTGNATDPLGDLERRLTDSLHGHLDPVRASGDLSTPARQRAKRLRRNRAVLIAAGAVVAALAAATPLLLNGPLADRRGIDVLPAETTSSVTSTSTRSEPTSAAPTTPRTSRPAPTAAPTHDADSAALATVRPAFTDPAGPPDVSHLHGTTVEDIARDRRIDLTVESELGGVHGFFDDGAVLGSVLGASDWDLVVWDGTGTVQAELKAATYLAFDSAHTRAAYVDSSERLHVMDSSGTVVATAPRSGLLATGIIGETVFVNDIRSTPGQAYTWDTRTGTLKRFDGRFGPAHAGAGLVLFFPSRTDGQTCFRLLDANAGLTVLWTACGAYFPTVFSPGGDFLVGGNGSDGGSVNDLWVMRTTDAKRVLRVDGNPAGLMLTFGAELDERERAVTVVAQDADLDQALLRCPLDGSRCTVVGAPERIDTGTASGISPPVWGVLR